MLIVFLLGGYILALKTWNASFLLKVIPTALALIASVTFWIEQKNNNDTNQSKFIMELNNQFISNDDFKKVEWELEKYYVHYSTIGRNPSVDKSFSEMFSINQFNRQALVNYMVHLEGVATLIWSHQLHLSQISNLMAYRYFIAVNNPVVQELELLPDLYKDYYQGIAKIYKRWEKYLRKRHITIPMEKDSLGKKLKKI